MKAIKVNQSTGDIEFNQSSGVIESIYDDSVIEQKLFLMLGINLGELNWDSDVGLNHNLIIANGSDEGMIRNLLIEYLEDQLGDSFESLEISNFKVDYTDRVTNLEININLSNGKSIQVGTNINEGGDDNAIDE